MTQHLHALQCDHLTKSTNRLLPYTLITILLSYKFNFLKKGRKHSCLPPASSGGVWGVSMTQPSLRSCLTDSKVGVTHSGAGRVRRVTYMTGAGQAGTVTDGTASSSSPGSVTLGSFVLSHSINSVVFKGISVSSRIQGSRGVGRLTEASVCVGPLGSQPAGVAVQIVFLVRLGGTTERPLEQTVKIF